MKIDNTNIKDVLISKGIIASKDKGQNFLINPLICSDIVDALDIKKEDSVLEVGPGLGSLTYYLSEKTSNLTLYEIDYDLVSFLKESYENVNITNIDALKAKYTGFDKIISNVPYNITTPLIEKMLMESDAKTFVIMTQKEVYNRFNSISGSEYCPLSILIHLLGKISKVMLVKPNNFFPTPKCDSVVFKIEVTNKNQQIIDAYKLSKAIFINRRKTILNCLSNYLQNKELAKRVLKQTNIEENIRPDNLPPNIYLEMVSIIEKFEDNESNEQ